MVTLLGHAVLFRDHEIMSTIHREHMIRAISIHISGNYSH